jgi:endoplasmic reticulum Man9GlcNAc2 1,2-alpha-mannosidase
MLGATTVHTTKAAKARGKVSVPPKKEELTAPGWRDWEVGKELIETCMRTHETAT